MLLHACWSIGGYVPLVLLDHARIHCAVHSDNAPQCDFPNNFRASSTLASWLASVTLWLLRQRWFRLWF